MIDYDGYVDPSLAANAPERRSFHTSGPQWEALNAMERYVDTEGGYRSGKTTIDLLKVGKWCWDYPGIPWLIARWTEENAFGQLKPAFLELWGDRVYKWLADEQCWLIYSKHPDVFSRVYVSGLKPSEGTSPFSKIHGKKFACVYLDQPEEVPEKYFWHFTTRLSAPDYPQQLLLSPNPPETDDHWIVRQFPLDNSRLAEGFRYIRFKMHDNVAGLGAAFIAARERDLKRKPAEYRRAMLGERGLPLQGDPVFGEIFDRDTHMARDTNREPARVELNPAVPLVASLDFGSLHPACTFTQYPTGRLHVLGGVMGIDVRLERFLEQIKGIIAEWFPTLDPAMLWWTADPAGAAKNPHGSRSAKDILHDFGIVPQFVPDANSPPRTDYAIQTISGYLERLWYDGTPVFALDATRFLVINKLGERKIRPVLADGFEVGFCWSENETYEGTLYPHVRKWKRDKWFEHPFATLFYSILAFAPIDAAEAAGILRNPDAVKRAKKLLHAVSVEGADRHMTPQLTDADVDAVVGGRDRRRIVEARVENKRLKDEWRDVRRRQRDDEETFRWDRSNAPGVGRGGYQPMGRGLGAYMPQRGRR